MRRYPQGLPVVWSGALFDATGYAEEARGFVLALDALGVDVRADPLVWGGWGTTLRRGAAERIEHLLAVEPPTRFAHVLHHLPELFYRDPRAVLSVGRTMFETDGLPPERVARCLFVSRKVGAMRFGAATAIAELNEAAANDIQPNVRKDGREIVFSSNRAGGEGGQDIWSATRVSVEDRWSAPVNLGSNVNTGLGESRPALSGTGGQLLFGRAGPPGTGEGGTGASDIYVSTRERAAKGNDD